MPIASAIIEPFFSARMARPGRESSSRSAASAASSAIAHTSGCRPRPVPRSTPRSVIDGMPRMPSYLPSHSILAMV